MNIAHWAEMGGYAAYVWPSYGISLAAICALVIWVLVGWQRVRAELSQLEALRDQTR